MYIKHLHVCNIILCELRAEKNYIKMSKWWVRNIGKACEKKKQILLNSYFGCSSSFNKAKNDSKTRKTSPSSVPRLLKHETVEENWMEKSLVKNWLWYDKDREYATNLGCKVCTQFREHIEGIKYFEEDWITGSTNYHSLNKINHAEGISHKKSLFNLLA